MRDRWDGEASLRGPGARGVRTRSRAAGRGFLLVFSAWLVGAAAYWGWLAPTPAGADDATVARFRYERAQEFYRQRRFEEALEEFFLIDRISANPRTSYNIALCFAQLGEEDEAFLAYAAYLARLPAGDADEGRRAQAERAMAALAPRVARLRVDSDPPGATIYVDRVELGAFGTTPRLLAVTPGIRTVRLELPGHQPREVLVEALAGAEAPVEATLVPIVGRLELRAPHPQAQAQVRDANGASVLEGPVPLSGALPPGTYLVEVTAPGRQPKRDAVQIREDTVTRRTLRLEAAPVPTGTLTVAANPAGALVRVDGEPVGFAPLTLTDQPAGSLDLALAQDGYQGWRGIVELDVGAHALATIQLEPDERRHPASTWVLGGSGLALLLAGIGTGIAAIEARDDFNALVSASTGPLSAQATDDLLDLQRRSDSLNLAADVLMLTGAVTLGAAIVLFVLEETAKPASSSASIVPFPTVEARR